MFILSQLSRSLDIDYSIIRIGLCVCICQVLYVLKRHGTVSTECSQDLVQTLRNSDGFLETVFRRTTIAHFRNSLVSVLNG